uniref:26S proteasome non-ATPase regulatory subunit 9 n=1 Tax=Lygus hesperus TaxID=30085 RepID=A0A0A9WT53_LYGHE
MGVTRGELLALEEEKRQIEKELDDAFLVLTNNNVGMDDPLVDADDYPRADISVYEVRHARTKIIRLRNDLNNLTERLSNALANYHQAHPADSITNPVVQPVKKRRRLAKVDFIEEGSPAAVCGLQNGDFILEIGNVSGHNFKGLDDIANAIKSSENFYMKVVVERGAETKRINLKPQNWGPNKGLLGCKIMTAPN